jgi:hypothetical protein
MHFAYGISAYLTVGYTKKKNKNLGQLWVGSMFGIQYAGKVYEIVVAIISGTVAIATAICNFQKKKKTLEREREG